MSIFLKIRHDQSISLTKGLIKAKRWPETIALMMLILNNIYLFMADFSIKYTIYIVELGAIKASAGRGVLLSRRHIIAEATPLVRNKKNKNKKPITPVRCEQYTILHFPAISSAVHCLYSRVQQI
jgi:hypothetical protein